MQGLIIENKANLYKIKLGDINYIATARGKFKNDSFTPVVGDIAEFSIVDENKKTAVIESVKERVSYIKRPKLANINQIVFVVSSKHPKPDLLLLDKQLAFAEFLHIKPVIVLNKIDLDDKHEFLNIQKIYDSLYLDDGKEFKYIGFKEAEKRENFFRELLLVINLLKNKLNDEYIIEDNMDFLKKTIN